MKLSSLLESLGNIGLVRKFDCVLLLWVDTGSMNVRITGPGTVTPGYAGIMQIHFQTPARVF